MSFVSQTNACALPFPQKAYGEVERIDFIKIGYQLPIGEFATYSHTEVIVGMNHNTTQHLSLLLLKSWVLKTGTFQHVFVLKCLSGHIFDEV